jgi:molybdopterin synthase catalytic subunit
VAEARVVLLEGPLPPGPASPPLDVLGAGAWLVFEGRVRPLENKQPIAALDYELYEPMARKLLEALAQRHADDFGLLFIQVEHSYGRVPVGACSFRLSIASPHRKEALAAMDRFIDQLKTEAPIWKQGQERGA